VPSTGGRKPCLLVVAGSTDAAHPVWRVRIGDACRYEVFAFVRIVVGHSGLGEAAMPVVVVPVVGADTEGVAGQHGIT
jgi:hypothetical protein